MPDVWELIKASSTLPFGDAWEHLNNLGAGGESIVVKDLEGTLISPIDLQGTIIPLEITGIVIEDNNIIGTVDENEPEGTIENVDIGGTVNEC